MGDQQPLLFGPSSDQPDASSLLVDLDDLFAENFYPENMDFSNVLKDFSYLNDELEQKALEPIMGPGGRARAGEKTIGDIPDDDSIASKVSRPSLASILGDFGDKTFAEKGFLKRPLESSSSSASATTNPHGVITVPPTLPAPIASTIGLRGDPMTGASSSSSSSKGAFEYSSSFQDPFSTEDFDDAEDEQDKRIRRKKPKITASNVDSLSLTEQQKLERRERNREHAKRSRIRKKVLLDLLQDQLAALRRENVKLRRVIDSKIPSMAPAILAKCTTEESVLLLSDEENSAAEVENAKGDRRSRRATISFREDGRGDGQPQQHARILMEPDFRLIQALVGSQQNFVLSDPSLPDNPIVYCSEGFCKITGYKRHQIIGRNCRFLQGPGTDQGAVDIIRKGVAEGKDISVCLLNYKANGTPFWNQFFVAALKDADGAVVNYVGVQYEVNVPPISKIKDRVKKLPIDG